MSTETELEGWPAWATALLVETVIATYWLDPGSKGKPYSAQIRFSGRRTGVEGKLQAADRFDQLELVEGILPGSGPVSITTRINGVNRGEWIVTAEPKSQPTRFRPAEDLSRRRGDVPLARAILAWGTPRMSPSFPARIRSGLGNLTSYPGSIVGSWPLLVGLGVLAGMALQITLIRRAHIDARIDLMLALTALLAGAIGAKLWYLATNRQRPGAAWTEGLSIQGFIAGSMIALIAGLVAFRIPIGTFVDETTPALFVGMAIGRPGCFFTGCCVGRPTASRWGIWSSDRRVGTRRVPVQLWEAFVALVIGSGTLALILEPSMRVPGAIALAAVSAYTLCRQLLFGFRAEPRKSRFARPTASLVAGLTLVSAATCWLLTCL